MRCGLTRTWLTACDACAVVLVAAPEDATAKPTPAAAMTNSGIRDFRVTVQTEGMCFLLLLSRGPHPSGRGQIGPLFSSVLAAPDRRIGGCLNGVEHAGTS